MYVFYICHIKTQICFGKYLIGGLNIIQKRPSKNNLGGFLYFEHSGYFSHFLGY